MELSDIIMFFVIACFYATDSDYTNWPIPMHCLCEKYMLSYFFILKDKLLPDSDFPMVPFWGALLRMNHSKGGILLHELEIS